MADFWYPRIKKCGKLKVPLGLFRWWASAKHCRSEQVAKASRNVVSEGNDSPCFLVSLVWIIMLHRDFKGRETAKTETGNAIRDRESPSARQTRKKQEKTRLGKKLWIREPIAFIVDDTAIIGMEDVAAMSN